MFARKPEAYGMQRIVDALAALGDRFVAKQNDHEGLSAKLDARHTPTGRLDADKCKIRNLTRYADRTDLAYGIVGPVARKE